VAEALGPEQGLGIVDRLALEDYHYLHSTRGELLRRLGRPIEARDAYRRALALVHDDAERRLLERRLAELETPAAPPAEPTDQSVLAAGSDSQPPARRREDSEDERDR